MWWFYLFIIAGLFAAIAPRLVLSGSGMSALEDEGCFVWFIRLLGIGLTDLGVWLFVSYFGFAVHHR